MCAAFHARSLSENYTESKTDGITALLNEGVYSWHSGKGVNEGNIWGDYFYLEALVRFKKIGKCTGKNRRKENAKPNVKWCV